MNHFFNQPSCAVESISFRRLVRWACMARHLAAKALPARSAWACFLCAAGCRGRRMALTAVFAVLNALVFFQDIRCRRPDRYSYTFSPLNLFVADYFFIHQGASAVVDRKMWGWKSKAGQFVQCFRGIDGGVLWQYRHLPGMFIRFAGWARWQVFYRYLKNRIELLSSLPQTCFQQDPTLLLRVERIPFVSAYKSR
jgi:hypothetical protein